MGDIARRCGDLQTRGGYPALVCCGLFSRGWADTRPVAEQYAALLARAIEGGLRFIPVVLDDSELPPVGDMCRSTVWPDSRGRAGSLIFSPVSEARPFIRTRCRILRAGSEPKGHGSIGCASRLPRSVSILTGLASRPLIPWPRMRLPPSDMGSRTSCGNWNTPAAVAHNLHRATDAFDLVDAELGSFLSARLQAPGQAELIVTSRHPFPLPDNAERLLHNPRDAAVALHQLGNIAYRRGDHDQALDYYRQSLTIQEELGSGESIARTISQIGMLLTDK